MSSEDVLREELTLLRAALARRLRAKVEDKDEPLTPALIEAVRKLLTAQGLVLRPEPAPRATPVTTDLPFQMGEED